MLRVSSERSLVLDCSAACAMLLVPSRMDRHSYACASPYDKTLQVSHAARKLRCSWDGQALVRLGKGA